MATHRINKTLLAALIAAQLSIRQSVTAHGYLKTPRSRNYHASLNPVWWGGTFTDPAPENCPQCLNVGGTAARCGLVGDHNYDYPPNAVGGVLPPIIQECYNEGSIVELETILTAHHKGHFTFKACAISPGEAPTQECFDAHPLTFVADEMYGATFDPLYPERAYIPRLDFPGGLQYESAGNAVFRHKFRLPQGLSGDLVLIQWHYVTGNSCLVEGYDTYDWPEGFYPGDLPQCGVIPPDGRGVPEQFWNCAEVRISNDCMAPIVSQATTTALPITTAQVQTTTTTQKSTTASSAITTVAAPPQSCAASTAACGPNTPCSNGMCCSQWGVS